MFAERRRIVPDMKTERRKVAELLMSIARLFNCTADVDLETDTVCFEGTEEDKQRLVKALNNYIY